MSLTFSKLEWFALYQRWGLEGLETISTERDGVGPLAETFMWKKEIRRTIIDDTANVSDCFRTQGDKKGLFIVLKLCISGSSLHSYNV